MPLSPSSSSSFVSFPRASISAQAPPCSVPRCPLHQQLSKPSLCRRRRRRRRRHDADELDPPTTCVARDTNSYNNSSIAEDVEDEQASSSNAVSIWTRLRAAVPLSKVFADHLGHDALHSVGSYAASQNKFKVICPFHNDRNPSLHIDDSLGLFHCFACGTKGSVIDFEQLIGGHRSVSTALRSLSSKYPPIAAVLRNSSSVSNVPSSSIATAQPGMNAFPIRQQPVEKPRVSRRARLTQKAIASDVLRDALPVYTAALWDPATPDGLSYLRHQRGLSDPTLRAFQCGFVPPHPKRAFILSHLHAHGHAPDDVVLAGIARAVTDEMNNNSRNNRESKINPDVTAMQENPTKRRFYDVFRGRVVFPIRDIEGTVLSFAARSLPGSASFAREPKYINGADSPLFSKRSVLFGADLAVAAHSATIDEGFVILVEGYLDAMAVFDRTQGRVACVASMGTALSHDQLRAACDLLSDKVDGKVIINFDADDAGTRAVERLCDVVIPQVPDCAHAIHIAFLPPPFKDADDMLARLQKEQQQHNANYDGNSGGGMKSIGSNGSDEYINTVLIGAVPWYQWRGDRIVQHELARMDEDGNDQQQQLLGRQKNVTAGGALLSSTSAKGIAEMEAALDLVDDETEFNVLMSDFLRDQHDDFALAFGAKAEDLNKSSMLSEVLPPQCSDAVLDQLGQVIARATQCMPWLNAAALAQVWADSLSHSTPRVLVTLCKRILNNAEQYAAPWAEQSLPVQMYWMPPPPWVLAELPAWKRKSMGYGQERIPPVEEVDNATAFTLEDVDLDDDTVGTADIDPFNEGIGDNGTVGDDDDGKYRFSEDTKFMKRSVRRLEAQQQAVVPLLQARQSDRAKRLTLAPRRSAEEIILRCLIFANETDRLTALQKLLDVIIQCGQKDLPFWTCANREQLFEYLVALQGSQSVDEMAAYLEEFDWFTAEIDDLFVAVDDETDLEWREIRELEISAPVQLVHATAHSVETMATKVARRMALDASSRVLHKVMDTKTRLDDEGGGDENSSEQLEEEMRLLCQTQEELVRQLDGSKFLTEEQVKQKEAETHRAQRRVELEKQQKAFWEEMEAFGEVEAPACVDGDAVELDDDVDDNVIAGLEY